LKLADTPIMAGTPQSNITLSENRAKSVYNYLIAHSITIDRLTYKGYGQTIPIATNDTPEGRATKQENRNENYREISSYL
jgi:outer membrane protein OmpA-like peptidoglycan-associated protein